MGRHKARSRQAVVPAGDENRVWHPTVVLLGRRPKPRCTLPASGSGVQGVSTARSRCAAASSLAYCSARSECNRDIFKALPMASSLHNVPA
jgi:hypothetical protein